MPSVSGGSFCLREGMNRIENAGIRVECCRGLSESGLHGHQS
jgi:hypothetical protein